MTGPQLVVKMKMKLTHITKGTVRYCLSEAIIVSPEDSITFAIDNVREPLGLVVNGRLIQVAAQIERSAA